MYKIVCMYLNINKHKTYPLWKNKTCQLQNFVQFELYFLQKDPKILIYLFISLAVFLETILPTVAIESRTSFADFATPCDDECKQT